MEWDNLWKLLSGKVIQSGWILECVDSIYQAACSLINIPFDLIVGKGKEEETKFAGHPAKGITLEYVPFPWRPEGLKQS
jgi:hypothetical protein